MNETGRGIAIGAGLLALAAIGCSNDIQWGVALILAVFFACIVVALTRSVCNESETAQRIAAGLPTVPARPNACGSD